jgi:hypothetical protein
MNDTMGFMSTSSSRLTQRIGSLNAKRTFGFQNISNARCHDILPNSSFSTIPRTIASAPVVERAVDPETKRMNLFTAINNALSIAMKTDPNSILFGQGKKIVVIVLISKTG